MSFLGFQLKDCHNIFLTIRNLVFKLRNQATNALVKI